MFLHLYKCKNMIKFFGRKKMINRIRRCSSRKEYEQLIDDYITVGYTVKARGEDNARLIKKGRHTKHGLVFLLTFW